MQHPPDRGKPKEESRGFFSLHFLRGWERWLKGDMINKVYKIMHSVEKVDRVNFFCLLP